MFAKVENIKTFKPGEIIFEAGSVEPTAYGVIEGEIEMVVNGKVVETITAGDLLGEGAIVQGTHQRFSTAIAKTDTQVALVDRDLFLFMIQETPLFALEVIRSLSTRLRKIKGQM